MSICAPPGCFFSCPAQARHRSGFRDGACHSARISPPPIPPNGEAHILQRGLLGILRKKLRIFSSPKSRPVRISRHVESSSGYASGPSSTS